MRVGGCPSPGIFQTPRLPGSQDARFVEVVVLVEGDAGEPGEEGPQKVSGRRAKRQLDAGGLTPSGAIPRISPVSARLTYLLLS
jgi:hypothetical protein